MAQASHRITHFPGSSDSQEPIAALPEALLDQGRDPTREIRNLIEDLQNTAHEARRRQRQAEEEREQFRDQVRDLERKLESELNSDSRVKALTRERDMLSEQQSQYGPVISDLNRRLREAETELREASIRREAAEHEKKQATRQLEEAERKKEEALRQKEAAIRQRDLAKEELKEAQEQAGTAKKNFTDAQKALAEARNELASSKKKGGTELSAQLASLRQARDGMAAQIKDLQGQIADLQDSAAETADARDAAEKAAKAAHAQVAELKEALDAAAARTGNADRIEELETELDSVRKKHAAQETELETIRTSLDAAVNEKTASAAALEEARVSLVAAQKQIEAIIHDRDTIKQQLSENAISIETKLKGQAAEVDRLMRIVGENEAKFADNDQFQSQFEQRRLDMIELTAQLENAHREIRNLSASLAEARLQAKLAARTASPASSGNAQPQNVATSPSHETACREEILAMRRCFQTFSRDQKQFGMLNELENYTLTIGDEAMENGRPILHRMAVAFASLLADLLEVPDQITQATLRTINQSIELIAVQLADPEIESRIHLKEARVYVVDDDQNTCATVVDALNLVGLQTNFALYSSAAVAELAGNHYDLIILDVHLPDLSGFELCSHIRTMALHAETPIFFVTGDASLENRVKSSLRGGNEFIAKPFSIQEIALKALKSVITSQLKSR